MHLRVELVNLHNDMFMSLFHGSTRCTGASARHREEPDAGEAHRRSREFTVPIRRFDGLKSDSICRHVIIDENTALPGFRARRQDWVFGACGRTKQGML